MTWKIISLVILTLISVSNCSSAPFIDLNEVHEAHSEFEVNLILNENRNFPIILVTVSNQNAKKAAEDILKQTFIN